MATTPHFRGVYPDKPNALPPTAEGVTIDGMASKCGGEEEHSANISHGGSIGKHHHAQSAWHCWHLVRGVQSGESYGQGGSRKIESTVFQNRRILA